MANLDEHALAKLAREMVMGIRNYKVIFTDFGITEEDFYEIAKNPYYMKVKEQIAIDWNATTSTADRLKLQNLAGGEVLLPHVIRRALMPEESLANINETLKTILKAGGLGEKTSEPKNTADRFVITINLGADVDGKPVIEHFDKPIEIGPGGDMSKQP